MPMQIANRPAQHSQATQHNDLMTAPNSNAGGSRFWRGRVSCSNTPLSASHQTNFAPRRLTRSLCRRCPGPSAPHSPGRRAGRVQLPPRAPRSSSGKTPPGPLRAVGGLERTMRTPRPHGNAALLFADHDGSHRPLCARDALQPVRAEQTPRTRTREWLHARPAARQIRRACRAMRMCCGLVYSPAASTILSLRRFSWWSSPKSALRMDNRRSDAAPTMLAFPFWLHTQYAAVRDRCAKGHGF